MLFVARQRYQVINKLNTDNAPIALFVFNRPDHVSRTLESLAKCDGFDPSLVYVFADGPRSQSDSAAVDETRGVVKRYLGNWAHYRFEEKNKGLAESIIFGVTELTEQFGRVIVLEDDLELSPSFLSYMNSALIKYDEDEGVKQVSGYNFAVPEFADLEQAQFFPLTTTWGWGTWRRAWQEFDGEAKGWRELLSDRQLRRQFNLQGAYDYSTMLKDQMNGRCDSWGIRWYWSVFRSGGIVCFPPQTLVKNIGLDGSGTHGSGTLRRFRRTTQPLRAEPIGFPSTNGVNGDRWIELQRTIWRLNGGWMGRVVNSCRRFGHRIFR